MTEHSVSRSADRHSAAAASRSDGSSESPVVSAKRCRRNGELMWPRKLCRRLPFRLRLLRIIVSFRGAAQAGGVRLSAAGRGARRRAPRRAGGAEAFVWTAPRGFTAVAR